MSLDDNADARARILGRIRKSQGRGTGRVSATEREAIATYLKAHPRGPQPELGMATQAERVARLRAKAEALSSTSEEVAAMADVPAAVARYLAAHKLATRGCVWPSLAQLGWKAAGLDLAARAPNGDDPVGVTGAFCAIAETGTLMMLSGPDTPASASLLPETHVAVVPCSRVVAVMEDGWDLARDERGRMPRAVNFISGPSRTGDIEQTIVLGAHGPYRVHLVLVTGA
jgi:L-lactate dehydrogenase complex protein LldG